MDRVGFLWSFFSFDFLGSNRLYVLLCVRRNRKGVGDPCAVGLFFSEGARACLMMSDAVALGVVFTAVDAFMGVFGLATHFTTLRPMTHLFPRPSGNASSTFLVRCAPLEEMLDFYGPEIVE